MAKFDLEQAEIALDDVENLLTVFWWFFVEERPDEKADISKAYWFAHNCKPYESVLNAAWDKIRNVRADMEAVINKGSGESKKKGDNAA